MHPCEEKKDGCRDFLTLPRNCPFLPFEVLFDIWSFPLPLMPFISFLFLSSFSSQSFFIFFFFTYLSLIYIFETLLLQKRGARAPSAPLFRGPCMEWTHRAFCVQRRPNTSMLLLWHILRLTVFCSGRGLGRACRGVTGIFFWGGKAIFLIFSGREMCFPGRKFPFWYTQNKFPSSVVFKSEKQKKKKKVLTFFYHFSYFRFQFSIFPFTIFLPFSLFPCLFFPDT